MPSVASSNLTWWLTAPLVTQSSSAAWVKLSLRAAASKALSALSGGKWRGIACFHEKIWGRLENRCFADKPFPALLVQLPATRTHSHKMEHPDVAIIRFEAASRPFP